MCCLSAHPVTARRPPRKDKPPPRSHCPCSEVGPTAKWANSSSLQKCRLMGRNYANRPLHPQNGCFTAPSRSPADSQPSPVLVLLLPSVFPLSKLITLCPQKTALWKNPAVPWDLVQHIWRIASVYKAAKCKGFNPALSASFNTN